MGKEKHNAAIVLAGGSGTRMGTAVPKQYLMLGEYPVIWYSLQAFEQFEPVQEVILVAEEERLAYCRSELIDRYRFKKVSAVVAGGAQRFDSVYAGLCALSDCSCVFVHDGARPFIDQEILWRNLHAAQQCGSAVTGMPAKDTVKRADENGCVIETPDRSSVWMIQTPQTFDCEMLREAYKKMYEEMPEGITDDAMVVERYCNKKVQLVEGSWRNIKITTPEDMIFAKAMLVY